MQLLGIISVDFDVIDQLLIRYSAFFRYLRKMGAQWDIQAVSLCRYTGAAKAPPQVIFYINVKK
jgi:hypothetical protein